MLPTHDIPAVRCEAAAPGVEVAVGGVACMDSMGPPRRVERRAGAFTHAPVAQSVEPVRSIRMLRGLHGLCDRANLVGSIAWVAGSNPAGRNFPFREVTK